MATRNLNWRLKRYKNIKINYDICQNYSHILRGAFYGPHCIYNTLKIVEFTVTQTYPFWLSNFTCEVNVVLHFLVQNAPKIGSTFSSLAFLALRCRSAFVPFGLSVSCPAFSVDLLEQFEHDVIYQNTHRKTTSKTMHNQAIQKHVTRH